VGFLLHKGMGGHLTPSVQVRHTMGWREP